MSVSVAAAPPALVGRRWLVGAGVWALAWAFAGAGLVIAVVWRPFDNAIPYDIHREFFLPDVVVAVVYAPVAALVLTRSRHPLGWLLAATAIGFGVTAFGLSYALLAADHPDLPMLGTVVNLVTWAWSVGAFAMVLVMPWLLSVDSPTGWRRRAAWAGAAVTLTVCLPLAFLQIPGAPENPLAPSPDRLPALERALDVAVLPLGVAYALVGAGYLLRRSVSARPEERRCLGWVIGSLVLVTASYAAFDLGLRIGDPVLPLAAAALFAGLGMLPAALLVLITRQRLWGLDVAVSRATLWGLLTALLVGAYLALVWAFGQLLPWGERTSGLVAAAVLALAVQPLRSWMQVRVDHLVYGTDAGTLLARFGDSSRTEGLAGLVRELRDDLRLGYVEVRSGADLPPVGATAGTAGGRPTVRLPLRSHGRAVGELVVGARAGESLDPRTRTVLERVSGMVAFALDLAQANQLLSVERDRVVEVRHEERRLLRRELHDSLGPALAGIGLGLAAIEKHGQALPERDLDLLRQLRGEVNRRADDVRTMAHALLPPALDEGRLSDALAALAARFSDADFEVVVDAPGADRIDSRRQVAVYHVVGEAVLNAFRHAAATTCTVRVEVDDDGAVQIAVHDDGTGLADEATPGIGLSSMRERADEAGGSLRLDTGETGRGTLVRVSLP